MLLQPGLTRPAVLHAGILHAGPPAWQGGCEAVRGRRFVHWQKGRVLGASRGPCLGQATHACLANSRVEPPRRCLLTLSQISKAELSHVIAACPPDTHSSRGEVFLVLYLKDATTVTMKVHRVVQARTLVLFSPAWNPWPRRCCPFTHTRQRRLQKCRWKRLRRPQTRPRVHCRGSWWRSTAPAWAWTSLASSRRPIVSRRRAGHGFRPGYVVFLPPASQILHPRPSPAAKSAKIDFVDARKERPLKCHLKVTEGFAYLLRQGVLFLTKVAPGSKQEVSLALVASRPR